MKEGTIASLIQHGFPYEEKMLSLKPSNQVTDEAFKKSFFKSLPEQPIVFFENEPINIHAVLQQNPKVDIVFVKTVHSQRAPLPPEEIKTIKGWING
jgi:hypothetical protein